MQGNYIDLIIILVLIYFMMEAFRHGFWVVIADFISFLGSILISLSAYPFLAVILRNNFSLTNSVANAVGFLIMAILTEGLLGFGCGLILKKLPEKLWKHKLNRILGVIPATGEGLILIAFVLTLAVALPIKPEVKSDIVESKIGNIILTKTFKVEKAVNEIFGGVINDSLTYLTVKPESKESVSLKVSSTKLEIDREAEAEIFKLLNEERIRIGIPELKWEQRIVDLARNYATYLWENRFFGHVSLDGKDVGDRLKAAKIGFEAAGENLALAPTVMTAHTGLMNSDGHRANILNTEFHKIGIGVIDNGIYGKIFVEVFTN
jgi:uncharacterized protein YkwD